MARLHLPRIHGRVSLEARTDCMLDHNTQSSVRMLTDSIRWLRIYSVLAIRSARVLRPTTAKSQSRLFLLACALGNLKRYKRVSVSGSLPILIL
jgi:hypothetical protein